jgi:hypothetical protein
VTISAWRLLPRTRVDFARAIVRRLSVGRQWRELAHSALMPTTGHLLYTPECPLSGKAGIALTRRYIH